MHEGRGNCVKYLKRGCNRKEGKGNKDFKRGRQARSRGGCLKKGGAGTPLQTMGYWRSQSHSFIINLILGHNINPVLR